MGIAKYEIGKNKVVQMQSIPSMEVAEVDVVISSWKNAFLFNGQDDSSGLRPAQLGALFAIKSHWIVSDEPATVVMPTGERVIIVTGCINVLVSRVSGTFIQKIRALLRAIRYNCCKQCMRKIKYLKESNH